MTYIYPRSAPRINAQSNPTQQPDAVHEKARAIPTLPHPAMSRHRPATNQGAHSLPRSSRSFL